MMGLARMMGLTRMMGLARLVSLTVISLTLLFALGCNRFQQATLIEPDYVAPNHAAHRTLTGSSMAANDGAHSRHFFDPVDRRPPAALADVDETP